MEVNNEIAAGCSSHGVKEQFWAVMHQPYAICLIESWEWDPLQHERWSLLINSQVHDCNLWLASLICVFIFRPSFLSCCYTWLNLLQQIVASLESVAFLQEFVAIAGSEALRNGESDPEKRIYPGGAFDPLGFTKKVCEQFQRIQFMISCIQPRARAGIKVYTAQQ